MVPGDAALWKAVGALWAAAFAVDVLTTAMLLLDRGRGLTPMIRGVFEIAVAHVIWLPLSAIIFVVASRFPLRPVVRPRAVAAHVTAAVTLLVTHAALLIAFRFALDWRNPAATYSVAVQRMLITYSGFGLVAYVAIVGAHHTLTYHRQLRERERAAASLETALARAELTTLRMQLQPHFLFNTLNGISALMDEDVIRARRMVTKLSDFLRQTIEVGDAEVSLAQELAFTDQYIDLQLMRFGERLRVERVIADDVRSARVPRLLLQPLVENAIQHGVARRADATTVRLCAGRSDGQLRIAVENDGPTLQGGTQRSTGIGLTNVRMRLAHLYGDAYSLALHARPQGGMRVEITLPVRW
jgi:hypothetical protein